MSSLLLGVDLGGTNVKTALVTRDRKIVGRNSRPTNEHLGPDHVMQAMEDAIRHVLAQAGRTLDDVLAVGFGAPGPMDWKTGVVFSPPNLTGWKNVPLADEMHKRLGIPCFVENDANAASFGEFWLGAGRGAENIAVLTLGTGVGGGVVVFGRLMRGIDGTAAELGHIKVQRGGRACGCGAQGCLEAYASVSGMVRTAAEALQQAKPSVLHQACGNNPANLTGKMIDDAAKDGDSLALWVFDETATWLGYGISSIINYQNPERIILCGGMIAAGERLFSKVREVAAANSFEVPAKRCQILPAGLGADSGVIGAAGCALSRLEELEQ